MALVTVVVATFGDDRWAELAHERALPSAQHQAPTVHVHANSLAEARNRGLELVETDHVIFLDADDALTDGYVETLAQGVADLRAPAVQYVDSTGRPRAPYVPRVAGHTHVCDADCLTDGNWCVIGTWAPTALVRGVGGFDDQPVYEDWSLWLRCKLAGATVEAVPAAIYRAWWRPDSRNRSMPVEERNEVHHNIASVIP